jgi:DNA polymerase IV
MLSELQPLINKVWRHCEDKGMRGRTVTLKVKLDFELITRSRTLPCSVDTRIDLESVTVDLLRMAFPMEKAVRLLGVSISGLSVAEAGHAEQMALAI